ncbi:MAG TPA: hypothetical protein VI451_11290, partial [Anaerolineales bacterium]|nr:hypothetical protein [Anaerolineales bacterium]
KQIIRSAYSTIWMILRRGWHLLVWEDVRAGTINLAGMPRSFRALMRLGIWLTVLLLISMIFSEGWRVVSPLQPLIFYNDHLAGLFVPELLVPVVFGLLAIAWAYLLAGALHAPWFAKLLVLFLFGMFDYGLMLTPLSLFLGEIELLLSGFTLAQIGLWNTLAVFATGVGWLFLLVLFLVRWRRPERPGLEFPLILAGMLLLLFSAHFGVQFGNMVTQTQAAVTGLQLTTGLEQMDTLLNPSLVIAGVEIVLFGMTVTRLVCVPLSQRAGLRTDKGRLWWTLGLSVFLVFRLWQDWADPLWNGTEANFSWGLVMIGAVLLPVFFWAYRRRPRGALPVWVIPGAAVLLFAILFVLQIGYLILATIGIGFILFGAATMGNAFVDNMSRVFDAFVEWDGVLVSLFALLVGLGLWLRARL